MSRCVQGRRLLNKPEQEVLRQQLFQAAAFSGLEVVTYCIMSNHFHVLVRAPAHNTCVDDAELIRRYQILYPKSTRFSPFPTVSIPEALKQNGAQAEIIRTYLLRRMHDVSEFMRTLKLRFSLWYNRMHDSFGTLWANRFHSVLIEDRPSIVRTVAAYIDLNPVRAGMVKDPKAYRFCGYADAVNGHAVAQNGICRMMGDGETQTTAERLAAYRCLLFGEGAKELRAKANIDQAAVRAVFKREGKLGPGAMLKSRLKHFTEGAVIGSSLFVRSYLKGKGRSPTPIFQSMGCECCGIPSQSKLGRH